MIRFAQPTPARRLALQVTAGTALAAASVLPAAPPRVTAIYPAGAMRGQTVECVLAGSLERWPPGIDVEGSGLTVEALPDKGKLRIRVDPEALPGSRWIRIFDAEGAALPRPFVAGVAPEALEVEPNDLLEQAAHVDSSTIVANGRLEKNGEVDCFAVRLDRGQTLVASLDAFRRLGSPMDGVLQVVTSTGHVAAQSDDDCGLDPLIAYQASAAGRYIVRLFAFPAQPNSTIGFAGGEDYVYRLTLTTGPFVDHLLPLSLTGSDGRERKAAGWNLAEGLLAAVPPAMRIGRQDAWPASFCHPTLVLETPWPSLEEVRRQDLPEPQDLPFPSVVSGCLSRPREVDRYRVRAPKGQAVRVTVDARSLGRPVDPVLRLFKVGGGKLDEADDNGESRDPSLTATVPEEGAMIIEVSDLFDRGGWRHAYALSLVPVTPDFALALSADSIVLPADKPAELTVAVDRRHGFADPIVSEIQGLPPGVACKPVESPPQGDASRSVKLVLERSKDAAAWSGPIRVRGKSGGQAPLEREARASLPGGGQTERAWLTVAPAAPKAP